MRRVLVACISTGLLAPPLAHSVAFPSPHSSTLNPVTGSQTGIGSEREPGKSRHFLDGSMIQMILPQLLVLPPSYHCTELRITKKSDGSGKNTFGLWFNSQAPQTTDILRKKNDENPKPQYTGTAVYHPLKKRCAKKSQFIGHAQCLFAPNLSCN